MRSILATLTAVLMGGVATAQMPDALDALTRLPDFRSMRASSAHEDLNRNGDARSIPKGGSLTLAELEGPGVITHIWCTVGSYDIFYPRSLVLRIYWDGMEKPSVEVPLGDFFGVGHGALSEFVSQPVANTSFGRARACYWRMPFNKSARITVTNDGALENDSFYYYVDWEKHESLPADTAYFHAEYRQAMPAEPGDYTLCETTGRGKYVGTVYSVHQVENGWFGEGDDRFYIDGEATPSLRGTGTEDYFCDAWGFRKFATPYYGVSLWEGYFTGDRVTAYRWHIADPVAFQQSLRVTMEHRGSIFTDQVFELGGFFERPDWISSVAFWYQAPVRGIERPLPPLGERLPPYRVIASKDMTAHADPIVVKLQMGDMLLYAPAMPDAKLTFDFEVPEDGRYVLQAVLAHNVMGALYQPYVDDKILGGPLDLSADGMDIYPVRLDTVDLTAGKHVLRFEGRGRSPRMRSMTAPTYAFGLHSLVLLRLQDMKGYQETMRQIQQERATPKPPAQP